MAGGIRSWPAVVVPLAVLAAACAVVMALPFRMIEPDDDDYFYGMHAFARGKVVMTQEEVRELGKIPLPDPQKVIGPLSAEAPGRPFAMGVRSPKGIIRERSPGHYALLAAFHKVGLDRWANVFLALAVVGFFYWFVRRQLEEPRETAVLASLLLIVNPTFLTMLYRVYMSDFDYFAWATVSLGLYFAARRTRRLGLCAAAGVSLSLSVLFRNTNAIAFLVVIGYEVAAFLLRHRELVRTQAGQGAAERHEPFGWTRAATVVACVAVGLVPLLWYSYATTGELLGSGYQYRLARETGGALSLLDGQPTAKYFALWDAEALFSLRHLFLGTARGMMSQGYTLSVGLTRLVLGYPLVVLAPAGLVLMERRRGRPALFLALWLAGFWGTYLCYRTIRADSFQFMCRKLSPALAPVAVAAGVMLARLPRAARWATFAVLAAVSLGITSEFFLQFLDGARRMSPGPPRVGGPMGLPPKGLPPFGPPPKAEPFEPLGKEGFPPKALDKLADPRELVQRLHGLMREAEERGLDVSRARQLDGASKDAAERGDWRENRRLLEEAVRSVERALGRTPSPAPPGEKRPAPRGPRGGAL